MNSNAQTAPYTDRPWTDPNANPYISIQNVTKKFGDFTAVNNVNLDIYQGEIFCLLGGSGCGKSTLLRMLAGFETPTEGKLLLDGQDLEGIPPYERPVNMMFQSYALFPHMNVEKNIAFGLKQDGLPGGEIKKRVDDILELVQLGQFAKRKPHQLSGGQRQRVALARSLVKKPKLLALDEPLGALDKKLREETQFELVNIQEELGITFLVVTHDQEEAMTLSSRIALMNAGQIVQVGTPSEVYEYPNSRYTAEFLGSINMYDGVLSDDELDHARITAPEFGGDVFINHAVSGVEGKRLSVAIRPEKISIGKQRPTKDGLNILEGKVEEIAYMGQYSVYKVRLPSGAMMRVTQTNADRGYDDIITWEDDVFLGFDGAAPVVLDK